MGGGAPPGDVDAMRRDLDKILGRDEAGTAQVLLVLLVLLVMLPALLVLE